ncbi:amino acid ABC superfamily ATP binding cassette transporter, membrane protein [Ligilactobacillus hayakitensis DSM 18933 = JCM 14209]|uniref:Amino acid ABC superfamily ATP binding cassette transporter, membrane protein n=1 Tax=Ligilactobacillus hayakitensis DSM 18933 = JCM 14209 TaxID=1423755 RepID=A0A0R1WQA4_9LACO|nr:ABC transporter substrate-binding protein/permease [Ligilactobacillus hayakitensis]KRM20074.1 amino acid ABC superfamily ATP binding cassette transporter, membrane protein [Ligilactobacillus hayakitensis DSM 18933 = JCM 14209]
MKLYQKIIMLLAMVLTLVGPMSTAFAADDASTSSQQTTTTSNNDELKKIKQKGTLVVGTSADYPPYEFTTKENGQTKIVGFEMEMAKQIAKDLGVKLVIKNMQFDSLLVALETGKVDVIISGMSPTAERKKSVAFSKIYYTGAPYLVINKADMAKYDAISDFKDKKVGAQNGSLFYDLIKTSMPDSQRKGLGKLSDLILSLQSHKIDGILMDEATAKAYIESNSSLSGFKTGIKLNASDTGTAIAYPKGATALGEAINKSIDKIQAKDLINKEFIPEASKYMESNTKQSTMLDYWKYFAKGVQYTLIITIIAAFFGVILGILLALMRLSDNKLFHMLSVIYIEFVRGTPLMVQVMFVYFGIGSIIQSLPAITAGIIAVALNSGAYVAEVFRSGIASIAAGQTEAARSLGLSKKQTFQYVVIPQAIKNIWPALGNEFISLIKESSIVSVIGVTELMFQTQQVQSATFKGVMPLFVTMCIYFVLTFSLSKVLNYFEGKMKHDN